MQMPHFSMPASAKVCSFVLDDFGVMVKPPLSHVLLVRAVPHSRESALLFQRRIAFLIGLAKWTILVCPSVESSAV